jgi:hypothetical protein
MANLELQSSLPNHRPGKRCDAPVTGWCQTCEFCEFVNNFPESFLSGAGIYGRKNRFAELNRLNMKQKVSSIREVARQVEINGMDRPFGGKCCLMPAGSFKTVSRSSDFLPSPPFKIKTETHP